MLSGLTNYLPETALTVFDNLEFFIRIVLAAILGALVGLERSKRQKEAGVRTHCIIACTSALFMILSKYAFVDLVGVDGLRGADPARIAAQVVSGISFLGAGVIFKNGNSIRGLTTAAGMWGHRRRRHGHRRGHVLGRAYRGRRTGGHPDRAPPLPRGGRRPDDPGDRGGNDGQR